MFSNDNNIESIAQLVEEIKKYVTLKSEYMRLDAVDKIVRLLTVVAMTFIIVILLLAALIFLSFSIAFTIAPVTGKIGAFAIVGGSYILLLLLLVINKKAWIEKPLVRFLASLLME